MTVRFQRLAQSTKGNRFAVAGDVWVAAEVVQDDVPVGHNQGKVVRLLKPGNGFPAGHVVTVGNTDIRP